MAESQVEERRKEKLGSGERKNWARKRESWARKKGSTGLSRVRI